ncbi:unnamed protein product [Trichobilharzia regenti]|nr:unnamed protein product [Trichobilharzia regenti]
MSEMIFSVLAGRGQTQAVLLILRRKFLIYHRQHTISLRLDTILHQMIMLLIELQGKKR